MAGAFGHDAGLPHVPPSGASRHLPPLKREKGSSAVAPFAKPIG
jgi:hypothetical protein